MNYQVGGLITLKEYGKRTFIIREIKDSNKVFIQNGPWTEWRYFSAIKKYQSPRIINLKKILTKD